VIALLVAGLLGSLHCVGMCGGFVLALSLPGGGKARQAARLATFLLGKACTYVLLGVVAGTVGAAIVRSGVFGAAQAVLAVVAGVLLAWAGLQIAGVVRELPLGGLFGPDTAYGRAARSLVSARHPAAPFVMGALTGLLPCPLVYAFLAAALAAGGVLAATTTMAVLGLASMPALAAVAAVGAVVSPLARRRIVRVSGVVVVLLGVVTFLRGVGLTALDGVLGHPHGLPG
jgi:sulfite exporter TauE/SafE